MGFYVVRNLVWGNVASLALPRASDKKNNQCISLVPKASNVLLCTPALIKHSFLLKKNAAIVTIVWNAIYYLLPLDTILFRLPFYGLLIFNAITYINLVNAAALRELKFLLVRGKKLAHQKEN